LSAIVEFIHSETCSLIDYQNSTKISTLCRMLLLQPLRRD